MSKKNRSAIPSDIAASILFDSDRTCCICRIRGKPVQIHHIDGAPRNQQPSNLAVLCFDCHRDTQIRGGFDRKLDSHQVILYRNDWIKSVQKRRALDETNISLPVSLGFDQPAAASEQQVPMERKKARAINSSMIMSLPARRFAAYRRAQPKWDTGITSEMVEGNSFVIDELHKILVDLAQFFPSGHFDGREPDDYFNDKIKELYNWHYQCLEPDGTGTGGTVIRIMVGAETVANLEKMVEDMVSSLTSHRHNFNFNIWQQTWRGP